MVLLFEIPNNQIMSSYFQVFIITFYIILHVALITEAFIIKDFKIVAFQTRIPMNYVGNVGNRKRVYSPRRKLPKFEDPIEAIAELEQKESEEAAMKLPAKSLLNIAMVNALGDTWKRHENDCGSSEVQIARAHARIQYLTEHMLRNKHDVASKRGMYGLVALRKKCTDYLYSRDKEKALEIVSKLNFRYRLPGRSWERQIKYAHFKNTKSKKVMKMQRNSRRIKLEQQQQHQAPPLQG